MEKKKNNPLKKSTEVKVERMEDQVNIQVDVHADNEAQEVQVHCTVNENQQVEMDTQKPLILVTRNRNTDVKSIERAEKIAKVISLIFTYAFIVVMALIVMVPFYWMIITSLKDDFEHREMMTFFPQKIKWENYSIVLSSSSFNFWVLLKNTLIVGVLSTLGTIVTTILAAFAFARLNFKGKDILFTIFLATMMIPGEMMVITNYMTVAALGWLDSYVGVMTTMIVPFMVSVFYIYLLRQNFKQIPNELYYAAKVDGKSDWKFLWKVMVPLATPTLITIFILKLMGAWNSYVWPNLVADREDWRLISNGLRGASFVTADGNIAATQQMAATVVVTLPLLLLFIFFRKYIMRGVGRAGLKG